MGSRCGGLPGATESERLEPPGNKGCAPANGIRDNPSTAAVGSATSAMRRRLALAGLAWGLRTVERESLERMNMSSSLVRSEERRVGKEWCCGMWRWDSKK